MKEYADHLPTRYNENWMLPKTINRLLRDGVESMNNLQEWSILNGASMKYDPKKDQTTPHLLTALFAQ